MEIVCILAINNHLTKNMIYDSIFVESNFSKKNYKVECDNGIIKWMPKKNFITLAEYRNKRIEEILNN